MFVGSKEKLIPVWAERWQPWGIQSYKAGIAKQTVHNYACEHCGKEYEFPNQANEPFYCDCSKLVSDK